LQVLAVFSDSVTQRGRLKPTRKGGAVGAAPNLHCVASAPLGAASEAVGAPCVLL